MIIHTETTQILYKIVRERVIGNTIHFVLIPSNNKWGETTVYNQYGKHIDTYPTNKHPAAVCGDIGTLFWEPTEADYNNFEE